MEKPAASQSTIKPKLILMVGLPGSGKSFFASQFADDFKIPFINLNQIRYILNAQPNFNQNEDALLHQIGEALLTEIFKTNKSVILEGDLHSRANRQAYARLARRSGYEMMVIWVQNVVGEAKSRFVRSNKPYYADQEQVKQIFDITTKRFTEPNHSENPVVISGKHSFNTQYKTILKKIVSSQSLNRPVAPKSNIIGIRR